MVDDRELHCCILRILAIFVYFNLFSKIPDPSSLYYKSTRNALKQIVQRESFIGLYKGILPQLMSIGPTSAIQFACYSTFTELYYYFKQDQLNLIEKFLSGSMSGFVGKTVVYPLGQN